MKVATIGAGYFARFHYEAWKRLPDVTLAACCDLDAQRAADYAREYDIPSSYCVDQLEEMLATVKPDIVDIITPPATHAALCELATAHGASVICQKPVAPTWDETVALVEQLEAAPVRSMIHENWRWQPWYREMQQLIADGAIGTPFHCNVHCRMGDGWGDDAYLERQPFFRDYKRLFIFETGVHFLDTFRFLFGEVDAVFASTAQRNPVIQGEDSAFIHCTHRSGVTATLDANRYNESAAENPRYTFGTVRIDGSAGHLELDFDGSITIKPLGQPARRHDYTPSSEGFAGDCVYATQRHFVDALASGSAFETGPADYLRSVTLVEAAYQSASTGQVVSTGS